MGDHGLSISSLAELYVTWIILVEMISVTSVTILPIITVRFACNFNYTQAERLHGFTSTRKDSRKIING